MMPNILPKSYLFRHILMVVWLLVAFVPIAEKTLAYGATLKGQVAVTSSELTATPKAIIKKKRFSDTLTAYLALKQQFSIEATILHVNFTLQQVVVAVLIRYFAVPANQAIPSYAARTPGISFIAQIVPITIQPNAP